MGHDFGEQRVLHEVALTVAAGEAVALLGPNGAGKSTLLQILATLLRPSEGTVRLGDWDLTRDRHRVRPHIGLVAHESLVYPDLTGRENLLFYARLQNRPDTVADAWLDRVGLRDAGARPVGSYSRGMKQRLAIARALLHEPDVVLLDEPVTGLDRAGQRFFLEMVAWLRTQGRKVVVVTHGFDAPDAIWDRVVVLQRGRVRANVEGPCNLLQTYDAAVRL